MGEAAPGVRIREPLPIRSRASSRDTIASGSNPRGWLAVAVRAIGTWGMTQRAAPYPRASRVLGERGTWPKRAVRFPILRTT
jgi:hypothetical protein